MSAIIYNVKKCTSSFETINYVKRFQNLHGDDIWEIWMVFKAARLGRDLAIHRILVTIFPFECLMIRTAIFPKI